MKNSLLIELVGYYADQIKKLLKYLMIKDFFYSNNVNIFVKAMNINKKKIILFKNFKPILINNFENYKNIETKEFQEDFNNIMIFSDSKKQLLLAIFWCIIK